MNALARFALNLPVEVDGDPYPDRRDDSRYCDECREISNHDGEAHRRAAAETPEEY